MLRPTHIKAIKLGAAAAVVLLVGVVFEVRVSSVREAREQVLRDDLATMRAVINQYTLDKNQRPQSLEDLYSSGYMKSLPKDPFTGSNATWVLERDQNGCIVGIHSGSDRVGRDGKLIAIQAATNPIAPVTSSCDV
jgi:general secretion pathway protein G